MRCGFALVAQQEAAASAMARQRASLWPELLPVSELPPHFFPRGASSARPLPSPARRALSRTGVCPGTAMILGGNLILPCVCVCVCVCRSQTLIVLGDALPAEVAGVRTLCPDRRHPAETKAPMAALRAHRDQVLLVRPDRYVAAAFWPDDAESVRAAVAGFRSELGAGTRPLAPKL